MPGSSNALGLEIVVLSPFRPPTCGNCRYLHELHARGGGARAVVVRGLRFCRRRADSQSRSGGTAHQLIEHEPHPSDYAPLLEAAGFAIDSHQESAGWADRVPATFGAVMEAMPTLTDEVGEAAAWSLQMEAVVTLQLQPYRRRVIVHARRLER